MTAKIIPFPKSRIVRMPKRKKKTEAPAETTPTVAVATDFWNSLNTLAGIRVAVEAAKKDKTPARCSFCDDKGVYHDLVSPLGDTAEFYCSCDCGVLLKKAQNP